MGKRSKRTNHCLENLHATLPKVQKTTIEVLDPGDLPILEVGEEGNDEEFTLDFILEADEDGVCSEAEESDEEFEAQIKNEAALLTFALILQNAQRVAVAAERRKEHQKQKCPKHYTGNSIQSKQRWAEKPHKMAGSGVKFITDFFGAKRTNQQKEIIHSSSELEEIMQPIKKVSLHVTALNL